MELSLVLLRPGQAASALGSFLAASSRHSLSNFLMAGLPAFSLQLGVGAQRLGFPVSSAFPITPALGGGQIFPGSLRIGVTAVQLAW